MYKENVLLNQTYLFVLRFFNFIMLLNHVRFVLKAKYLNQCITTEILLREFNLAFWNAKVKLEYTLSVAAINLQSRPGRKKNGTRVVIARLNYEIFLWRAHAQNDLRRVFLHWGVWLCVMHIIFTSLKMQYSSWMRVLFSQLFSLRTIRRIPLHFIRPKVDFFLAAKTTAFRTPGYIRFENSNQSCCN